MYHRDRFRAIRGRVADADGRPIAGALVQCVRLEGPVDLARAGPPPPAKWCVPIEAETRTDDRGRYEFPHPARRRADAVLLGPVGAGSGAGDQGPRGRAGRPGRTARRDPGQAGQAAGAAPDAGLDGDAAVPDSPAVVAETGVGDRAGDVAGDGVPPPRRAVPQGADRPGRVGKVVSTADHRPIRPGPVGRGRALGAGAPVTRYDLPEAAGIEPWRFEPSTEERLFYAAMSPVPLFWRESPSGWPS